MFLIHSPIILEQSGITHWWVESFWDIDKQKAVLNGKDLHSPDNSIRESCGGKNGIGLEPVPLEVKNCLIFLLWGDERKVAIYELTSACTKVSYLNDKMGYLLVPSLKAGMHFLICHSCSEDAADFRQQNIFSFGCGHDWIYIETVISIEEAKSIEDTIYCQLINICGWPWSVVFTCNFWSRSPSVCFIYYFACVILFVLLYYIYGNVTGILLTKDIITLVSIPMSE